jgi:pyruvate,water dikinase
MIARSARVMLLDVLPFFVSARAAMTRIRGIFAEPDADEVRWLSKLDQSLPGNVTVEMGLALAELAEYLPRGMTLDELEQAVHAGTTPEAFRTRWERFIARYGHRGPGEIDVANPRYRDRPRALLSQLLGVTSAEDPESLPHAVHARSQRERREAYEALVPRAQARGWLAGQRFGSLYRVVEALGGLRETPKFVLVRALDRVRRRALAEGEALRTQGRLDAREDVFALGFDALTRGARDASVDLRALVRAHRASVRQSPRGEVPRLIDSRGRILRPAPTPPRAGELGGHAISAGVVRGPVKVLHAPDEKPLLPGEVLVARATDPGWTPLFVNAAAVVLEVGGMMQHGALVAREYGKACVAGVERATELLRDGELVEVDGSAGVVRRVAAS